jgi:hypothetical protein
MRRAMRMIEDFVASIGLMLAVAGIVLFVVLVT